jgi:hypothetical protein
MGSRSTRSKVSKPGIHEGDNEFLRAAGHLIDYASSKFKKFSKSTPPPPPPPMSASGGTTYTPGNGYKYHKFSEPNSDNFVITSLSPSAPKNKIDILIVAGGGGNRIPAPYNGGAGAGGVVHVTNVTMPATGTYPVGVGAGGPATFPADSAVPQTGGDSTFGGHPIGTITAKGGGGGGWYPANNAKPGGSGGGKQDSTDTSGTGIQPAQNSPWTPQPGFNQYGNPGGGGAGEVGGSAPGNLNPEPGGYGGDGVPISGFEYPLIGMSPIDVVTQGNSPTSNHYGGGGMGWGYEAHPSPGRMRSAGGGGTNNTGPAPQFGPQSGTDGLGGGAGASDGGTGGDGMVVIRYPAA